jgi:hypothetical protein
LFKHSSWTAIDEPKFRGHLKVLWKEDHHQKGHPKYQVGLELNPEEVPLDILAAIKSPDQWILMQIP